MIDAGVFAAVHFVAFWHFIEIAHVANSGANGGGAEVGQASMPGSMTTRGRQLSRDVDICRVAFCGTENISTPNLAYAAQYLACALPCERFTSALADNPCITRGRCGSLLLHRDGLPPSTFCRSPGAPVHHIKTYRVGSTTAVNLGDSDPVETRGLVHRAYPVVQLDVSTRARMSRFSKTMLPGCPVARIAMSTMARAKSSARIT
jgi:hypothetical protein